MNADDAAVAVDPTLSEAPASQPALLQETDSNATAPTDAAANDANGNAQTDLAAAGEFLSEDETSAPVASTIPKTDIEVIADRLKSLEERMLAFETLQGQQAKSIEELSKNALQAQQTIGSIIMIFNQLAARVNGMDPNRPVLEISLVDKEPVLPSPGMGPDGKELPATQAAWKATYHNETHPEKPNQLEVLRLDKSDPNAPHWVPVGTNPVLSNGIHQQLKAANVPADNWQWIIVREIKREPGQTEDCVAGTYKGLEVPVEPVAADNDAAAAASEVANATTPAATA